MIVIATTDPLLGGNIALAWGHAVYSDIAAISNVNSVFNIAPSPVYANNTTSYTNVVPWVMGLTKLSNTSKLVVMCFVSSFTSTVGSQPLWALQVDGTDYPVAGFFFNVINQHMQISGGVVIPNLTAGPKTLQVRGKLQAGANMQHDANDRMSMISLEIP